MAMTVVKLTVMVMEVTVVKETRIPLTTGNEKHPHHRMVEPTGGMLRARGLAFRTATSGDVWTAVVMEVVPVATPLLSQVHRRALTSTLAMRTKLLAVKLHRELPAMKPSCLWR